MWPISGRVGRKFLFRAEHRNILVDAFLGGFWVAAMQFNPLPSAATLSMMAMNNVAIGGLRFLLKGAVAQLLGIGLGLLVFMPAFCPANQSDAAVRLFAFTVDLSDGAGLDLLSSGPYPWPTQA